MTQALVRAALETALDTWADAQSIPVAWENVDFDPPASIYIRANILPAQTQSLDLLGKHRGYRGIFQVTLCMPRGVGPGASDALVADLDETFPRAAVFTAGGVRTQIVTPMSASTPIPDDDALLVPVSCQYLAHVVLA